MIQDIQPNKLFNSFQDKRPGAGDLFLLFNQEGKVCVKSDAQGIQFPDKISTENATYLFAVNEQNYFLLPTEEFEGQEMEGYEYKGLRELRGTSAGTELFVVYTAYHLWLWYSNHVFCGKCGTRNVHMKTERALQCPSCGHTAYPRINPAVIVGIRNGDQLLLTKYRTGYGHNALVAGFTEIGETLEQTVEREVMEETGLHVKNITYYKSQPWGIAQDILVGYYCDVDGDTRIRMDKDELKYAEWVERGDIILQPDNISLTNEMMSMFKDGKR